MSGFKLGSLPVKYLGVPLITTKLKALDCQPLVEKIIRKIKNWTNRVLSYAGRAQLVKSVLFSMQVYWASMFIIPKKVIRDVEAALRAFFWSGNEMKTSGAKVAWEHLCVPRNEGGLGFKGMEEWTKAANVKHIWSLFSGGGEVSMWCQWVKSYLLRNRSFWDVKILSDPSWVWRKLLSLRNRVKPFIKHWAVFKICQCWA